jgi:hypothetical protein
MRRLGRAGEIRKIIKLFFKKPLTSGAFCGIIVIEGKVGIVMDKNFYGENVFFDNGNMGGPNESKEFLEGLAKTERLLKNQEQIIEDAQELKRLLTLNYRTKIISYKTIYDISRPMIKKAQEELTEKDGRKKKKTISVGLKNKFEMISFRRGAELKLQNSRHTELDRFRTLFILRTSTTEENISSIFQTKQICLPVIYTGMIFMENSVLEEEKTVFI